MAYQDDIPQEDDALSTSQEDLLNNFQAISAGFNINHEGFNDPNKGAHKFLNMPQQEEAPATTATGGALYTKEVGSKTDLFYREKSSGKELKITNAFTANSTGNIIVPGGIRFSWGAISFGAGSSAPITPAGITTILNIQFSVNGNVANTFAWSGLGANSFKIIRNSGSSATNITWLVIGV